MAKNVNRESAKNIKKEVLEAEKLGVDLEEGLEESVKNEKNFVGGKEEENDAIFVPKNKEYFSRMSKKKMMKYCESPYNTIRDGTQGSFFLHLEKYLPKLPEMSDEDNALFDTIMRVGEMRYATMEEEQAKALNASKEFGAAIGTGKKGRKPKPTLEYRDDDGELHSPDWMPYERARTYLVCLAKKGSKHAGFVTGYNPAVITVLKKSDKFFAAMYEEALALYNANRNERLSEIMMERLENGTGSDKLLEFALERLDRQNYNLKAQDRAEESAAKNMHIDNAVIYNLQVPPQLMGGGNGE